MQITEDILMQVAADVLESMAFAVVLPISDEGTGGDSPITACAMVLFGGTFSGKVVLTVPNMVVPDLVKDMLDEEDPRGSTREAQYDALGELANVMCGNLLRVVAGPEPVFDLEAPTIIAAFDSPGTHGLENLQASVRIGLEHGWAELGIILDDPTLVDQAVS